MSDLDAASIIGVVMRPLLRRPVVLRHTVSERLAITRVDHHLFRAYSAFRLDIPTMILTATATVMDRSDGSGPVLHWISVVQSAEQRQGFGIELLETVEHLEGRPMDALWMTASGIALADAYERRHGARLWTKQLMEPTP